MKKSFILHIDSLDVLSELDNEQKGLLFQAMVDYQTGNEVVLSGLMKAVFVNFKNQFDRDNQKYSQIVERNKQNGAKGGRQKQTQTNPKEPSGLISQPKETQPNPNKADSDSKSVNDNESKNVKENNIEERKLKFSSILKPYLEKFGKEVLNDFYRYWTEPNQSNTKFRKELEKTWDLERRLDTWVKNDFNKKNNLNKNGHTINNQSDKSKDRISTDFTNFGKRPKQ